ncbi:MAG TPA: hypothetical protein VKT26_07730 [Acetobacteraceae bacterium]|nr:hypothetical protein [Acetobacteraceae bacterium]
MHVIVELDPVAAIRAEARLALGRPLPVRFWRMLSRMWSRVSYG